MIGTIEVDIASVSAGCGCFSLTTTVWASGVSTPVTAPSEVLNGWLAFWVSIENLTSAEVTGLPSWNVASVRSLKVTDLPSAEVVQLFAR